MGGDVKRVVSGVARDLKHIETAFMARAPWLALILKRLRVVAREGLPVPAMVRGGVIYIDLSQWRGMSADEKVFTIFHEVLHVALKHHLRVKRVECPVLYNLACDCIVNEILSSEGFHVASSSPLYDLPLSFRVSLHRWINPSDLLSMSAEELYVLLMKLFKSAGCSPGSCPINPFSKNAHGVTGVEGGGDPRSVYHGGGAACSSTSSPICPHSNVCSFYREGDLVEGVVGGDLDGYVVQEGDREMYEEGEVGLTNAVRKAIVMLKMAGAGRGTAELVLSQAIKPKVNWRAELRSMVRHGLGLSVVSTWRKPSRKHPSYPGVYRFKKPDIYAVVDVSGSIGQREIDQFFAELFAAARLVRVFAVFFDDGVRRECRVKPGMVPRVKGGGGTVISPALMKVYSKVRKGDVVVVLTDGAVADVDEQEAWLRKVKWRASKVIYCSTCMFPEVSGVEKIKIEIGAED